MKTTYAAVLFTLLLSAPALAGDASPKDGSGSPELHHKMMEGSKKMTEMKMSGDVDHDFLMAMKQHHQDGIEMANVVLKTGKDPDVKKFARETIAMQKKDIAEIDAKLKKHGMGGSGTNSHEHTTE